MRRVKLEFFLLAFFFSPSGSRRAGEDGFVQVIHGHNSHDYGSGIVNMSATIMHGQLSQQGARVKDLLA